MTNIKLDFIKIKELLSLLENIIRGGISIVMGDRFVESNENKKILYIDGNNLYGWAMSQYLPTGTFEKPYFPEEYELEQTVEDLRFIPDNNPNGFFIECDLEYPVEIKEKTENFVLFKPKQIQSVSHYKNSVKQPNYKPTLTNVCDLTNKQKFIIHYRLFKFYTKMGMKVTHLHTIYRFKQSPWLAKYIDHNTQKAPNQKQTSKKACTN